MSTYSLIIIRGPSGAGKTTISKILAERINAKYIPLDQILEKEKLNKINPKDNSIPLMNFLAVQEEILEKIKEYLEKQSVIIDGDFYHKEQIEFFEKNIKSRIKVITLKARLETCVDRDSKKDKPVGKKIVENVYRLVSRFDAGFPIEVGGKSREQVLEIIQQSLRMK